MYIDSEKQRKGTPQGPVIPNADTPQTYCNVRAVVLLAGSVRSTNLRKATERFVMDLPLNSQKTVLDSWHDHLDDLAYELGLDHLPARVMINQTSDRPNDTSRTGPAELKFQQDPLDFRGTGGLVSDVAKEYDDDDYLIVATANQVLFTPLPRLFEAMAAKRADVCLLSDRDSRPRGITLIRCGVLRDIASVGFVDLNEQALPEIAKRHRVKVCRYDQPAGMAIRTRQTYLDAVKIHHERMNGKCQLTGCETDEDWNATFSIIEPGASVDPSAVVHDSVVLAGGRVEANAVLVRSIVGSRGWVRAGESVVDRIESSGETRRRRA